MKKLALFLVACSFVACKSQKAATPTPTPAPVATTQAAAVTPEATATRSIADARAEPGATPFYFTREITRADLEGRTLRELNLMRNVIYARAGNPFRKRWLHEFFSAQTWYQPKDKMDESMLSKLDRRNAEEVAAYEVSLTRQDLEKRRDALLARVEASAQKRLETLVFSPDGKTLATGGAAVELWDLASGRRTKTLEKIDEEWKNDGVALSFSDDGKTLAVVHKSGSVTLHDLVAGASKEVVKANASNFFTDDSIYEDRASFARGPWRVAIANLRKEEETTVTVHELPSGKPLTKLGALESGEVSFSPDGAALVLRKVDGITVVSLADKTEKVIDLGDRPETAIVIPGGLDVVALAIQPKDDETDELFLLRQPIAGGAPSAKVALGWREPSHMLGRQAATVLWVSDALAIVEGDRVIEARELPTGAVKWKTEELGSFLHLALSPDKKRVAVAIERDDASDFRLFDVATGAAIPLAGHEKATPDELLELQLLSRAIGAEIPAIAMRGMAAEEVRTPLDDVSQLDEHLKVDQLKDLSRRDLRLLRNAIYARRGRPFKSPVIREHFERMVWYKADPKYADSRLTAVDQHNIKIVQSVENELGGPLTDAGHIEEEEMEIEASINESNVSFEGQRWYSGA